MEALRAPARQTDCAAFNSVGNIHSKLTVQTSNHDVVIDETYDKMRCVIRPYTTLAGIPPNDSNSFRLQLFCEPSKDSLHNVSLECWGGTCTPGLGLTLRLTLLNPDACLGDPLLELRCFSNVDTPLQGFKRTDRCHHSLSSIYTALAHTSEGTDAQ